MSLHNTDIQGSASISRNVGVGGNAEVKGSVSVDHDLTVKGWLEARNVRVPLKGLFASESVLKSTCPSPRPGWYALVGDGLPAAVWRAVRTESGRAEWVATGKTGGQPVLYLEGVESSLSSLRDETGRLAAQDIARAVFLAADTYGTLILYRNDGTQLPGIGIPGMDGEKAGLLTPARLESIETRIDQTVIDAIKSGEFEAYEDHGTIWLTLPNGTRKGVGIPGMDGDRAGLLTPAWVAHILSEASKSGEAAAKDAVEKKIAEGTVAGNAETADIEGYAHVRTDASGRVTDAIRDNGEHEMTGPLRVPGLSLPGSDTREEDGPEGTHSMTVDSQGRVLAYVDRAGVHIPALVMPRDERRQAILAALCAGADRRAMQTEAARRAVLRNPGRWRREGSTWRGPAMLTIHDDDTIDMHVASSGPSAWMTGGGYATTLFAVLTGLGLRGCLSMEGQRCGLTSEPPVLNDNGRIVKMLQDRYGWEVQSHSMTARYQTNNWWVPSLDSDLAAQILAEAVYEGARNNSTTSVYDASTGRQYSVNATRDAWEPTPEDLVKPYVMDYTTKREKMYNPAFPIDYQWGDWFRAASWLGIRGNAWVTPGETSSHANVPLINAVCPYGFESDGVTFHNLPPLGSTATRMMLEGQQLAGYAGEQDTDNTYKPEHYDFYKAQIDEAGEKGAWIVLGLHAYRPCWRNSLSGVLVSEGGDYPDEWVNPVKDPLNPAVPEGWHPCPGTRLHMLWDLLKYARDKGMLNVTSSEGFARMGNAVSTGYWNKGIAIGPDRRGIEGTRSEYPHYVIGADGSEDYYSEGEIS